MQVAPRDADRFVATPPDDLRAVLVYGPDGGLVRERAEKLAKSVVADLSDPFLVAELTGDQLKDDPARLADEAAAIALTGGRRVVRLRDVGDGHAKLFLGFLEDPPGDALVVAAAGDLKRSGALVKAFEKAGAAAAVACYGDDARALDGLLHDRLRQDGIEIDPAAADFVLSQLGADRAISRMEIEKLALYAGPKGRIGVEDAMAVVGDSAALALDDCVHAAGAGDAKALDRALARAYEAGTSPIAVLRALAGHLAGLHRGASALAAGAQPKAIAKAERIFWKREAAYLRQIGAWRPADAAEALRLVLDAEAASKRTGAPAPALAGRAAHAVAAKARGLMRGRRGR